MSQLLILAYVTCFCTYFELSQTFLIGCKFNVSNLTANQHLYKVVNLIVIADVDI